MNTVKMFCALCGKEIALSEYRASRFKNHFCNKECQLKYISQHTTATKEKCEHCGKDIFRTRNQKRNSKTGIYFCCRLCQNKHIARKCRWSDNPKAHRGRRGRILESASFKCQKCGYNDNPKMFDVHHADGNHSNNKWMNLRCICSWCHGKHHRKVELIENIPPLFISEQEAEKLFYEWHEQDKLSTTKLSMLKRLNKMLPDTPKKCPICGNTFMVPAKDKNKQKKICCSLICSKVAARKVVRPDKESLVKMVWQEPTSNLAKKFGVSDVAIAKWCKRYGISKPPRGYWAKIASTRTVA